MNRHVEALAEEFLGRGHHVRVLAPFDPPGRLSRGMHRAAPEPREAPDYLIPLGRTVGIPSNGAISNLAPFPAGGVHAPRRELRRGEFDVVHIHEPLVPLVGWNAALGTRAPAVGTFHAYSTKATAQPRRLGARRPARLQPALGADRGLRGGRLDRAPLVRRPLRDDPQRRRRRRRARRPEAARGGAARALRRPARGAQGPAGPAHRLRRPGRARAQPAHRDRRRARGRAALPRRPRAAAPRSTSAAASRARRCTAPCTRPTCSARPRSRGRASAWS